MANTMLFSSRVIHVVLSADINEKSNYGRALKQCFSWIAVRTGYLFGNKKYFGWADYITRRLEYQATVALDEY